MLVFLTYVKRAFKPSQDFAKYTARLAKATAAGERIMEVLEEARDIADLPDAVSAPPLRGEVEFADVSFAYRANVPVLRSLNLHVAPGSCVAIVGASGVGKSTLVSLILRLYDPDEGCVMLDGRDMREYKIESVRSQISTVRQDTTLFATSIQENIRYGNPEATEDDIRRCAELARAHHFISEFPEGYETIVGEQGVTLSRGQRQRIAIARAALREAPLLLLYEPTTGLDEINELAVTEVLNDLARHGRGPQFW